MKVQSINNSYLVVNNKNYKPAFSGYKESMHTAITKKFNTTEEVSKMAKDLYFDILQLDKIKIDSMFFNYNDAFFASPITFLREICRPIAEVVPELRDIIFESENKNIKFLTDNNGNELTIHNDGKIGFFNTLFKNQDAMNDMRMLYSSEEGYVEISMKKDHSIKLEQGTPAFWNITTFNPFTGKADSYKSRERTDIGIW